MFQVGIARAYLISKIEDPKKARGNNGKKPKTFKDQRKSDFITFSSEVGYHRSCVESFRLRVNSKFDEKIQFGNRVRRKVGDLDFGYLKNVLYNFPKFGHKTVKILYKFHQKSPNLVTKNFLRKIHRIFGLSQMRFS